MVKEFEEEEIKQFEWRLYKAWQRFKKCGFATTTCLCGKKMFLNQEGESVIAVCMNPNHTFSNGEGFNKLLVYRR